MMEQLHNLLVDVRWAIKQLNEHLERIEPTPSSEGEARESSPLAERQTWESEYNRADALRAAPPLCPAPNAPWQDWCHWFDSLDNRVRILEAGPPTQEVAHLWLELQDTQNRLAALDGVLQNLLVEAPLSPCLAHAGHHPPTPSSEGEATESSPISEIEILTQMHEAQESSQDRLERLEERLYQEIEWRKMDTRRLDKRLAALEAGPRLPELTSLHGRCPTCGRLRDASLDTDSTRTPTT
jgi:hypothetical protein